MKTKMLVTLTLCLVAGRMNAAPLGTAFSYQGFLSGAGAPATGNFDFEFSLFDAANNGNQVGPALTNLDVTVNNGLFLVTLDFGNVFDGNARWLALGVRTNGSASGAFTALTPLQMLAPTPYALFATNAGASGNVISGSISAQQLSTPGGSPAAGEVLGFNGTNLVWINGGGGGGNFWSLTGNAGTTAGANFLGTTDLRPLELHVSGVRGWQLMPTFDTPNLIGGAPGNYVSGDVQGATIAGGGTILTYGRAYSNSIFAYHGTIGGGLGNTIQSNAYESTIAGGNQNSIQSGANDSMIGGGYGNTNQAPFSTIAGGQGNLIQSGAYDSTITGGYLNKIQNGAAYSAIGGGLGNSAGAPYAVVPGGSNNTATGSGSFAAGINAHTSYPGSFVWGDGTQTATGTGSNRFEVVATGGVNFYTSRVGINTASPQQALDVNGGFVEVQANGAQAFIGGFGGAEVEVGSFNPSITAVSFVNLTTLAPMHINCSSITIQGGADLAEPFQISARDKEAPQGAVVVIDEANPGHLRVSELAYDTHVAGVISGANGVNPGIQMQQQGLLEGGQNVALTGRVYVQADTSNGRIKPGDLLTTSSLPGRAMKVTDHARAQGAILGKAMTGLEGDKGIVLVLVTLQ